MSQFGEYVSSTAFSLSLSHKMIDAMSQMHAYGKSWCLHSTYSALKHRGLAENVSTDDTMPVVSLTKAGQLMIPLLKEAGLFVEYPQLTPPVELPEAELRMRKKYEPQT